MKNTENKYNDSNNIEKKTPTNQTKDIIISIVILVVVCLGWYFLDYISDILHAWSDRQKLNISEFTNSFFSNLPPILKTIVIAIIIFAIIYSFRSEIRKILNWEKLSNMKKKLSIVIPVFILAIGLFIYYRIKSNEAYAESIARCEGYEGKINLTGKWLVDGLASNFEISFKKDSLFIKTFEGQYASGTYELSGSVLRTSIINSEIGKKFDETLPYVIKICDITNDEFYFRELNNGITNGIINFEIAKRIKD